MTIRMDNLEQLDLAEMEEFPEDEPSCDMVGGGGRVRIRTDRTGAEGAPIPPVKQGAKGGRERFSGQGYGVEPGADDAADSALDQDAANREKAGTAPPVSTGAILPPTSPR